jgi:hypothetical protein
MSKIETTLSAEQVAIAEALFAASYQVTLGKRAGDAQSRVIPLADFPLASWQSIVNYGVQRRFNDATGGSDKSTADKMAQVDEMIAAFKAGEVGRARAAGVDALTSEIRVILRQSVKAEMGAEAYKVASNVDDFDESLDAMFAEQTDEVRAQITELAKAEVARKAAKKAAMGGLKVSLGKLAK